MKEKTALALIAFIMVFSALLFPGRLHGLVELFSFPLPPSASGLVQGADGNFYGTTTGDGAGGYGTVFQMTPGEALRTLVSFNGTNGSNPSAPLVQSSAGGPGTPVIGFYGAPLVQGSDGNIYGTTVGGGADGGGTVFKMTPGWALTTLVSFNGTNGSGPNGLVQSTDGSFYGTTSGGGAIGYGTVFKMIPSGVLTTLVSFNGTNGDNPLSALVQGSDGNFYGTTEFGGASNEGTVFQVTSAGVLTTLYSFTNGADGCEPVAVLAPSTNGNFYGTALGPWPAGNSTVFEVTPTGLLTSLASLGESYPYGMVQGSDGNFYGTTEFGGASNEGTVFQVTSAGVLTTLYSFTNGTDGANPQAGLVQGSDGNFYGTTSYSGGLSGDATPWDGFVYQAGGGRGGSYGPPPSGAGSAATVFKVTSAGTLTTLVSFISTNGYDPNAGLVQGSDSNFYGTTVAGGVDGDGTVFRMTAAGVLTTMVSFNGANGSVPVAALVQGSNGDFYGTTWAGGASNLGTVFQMTSAGALTTLYSFTNGDDGSNPHAPLLQGSDGNFYGTTFGFTDGYGTVFRMTPAGVLTTLVGFSGSIGEWPFAGLVQGSDGNFYGTTQYGGGEFSGTVYKMTPGGALTTLVVLSNLIAPQEAGLVQGSDGNFYGTTTRGGTNGAGSAFKMTSAGALTTLYSFSDAPYLYPYAGLVQGKDGNFYGTTYYDSGILPDYVGGTAFKITPAGVLTTLVSFNGANGNGPQAGLVQGSDGNFYGTTDSGGSRGGGNIFRIDSLKSSPPMTVALASNQVIVSWPEDYPAFTLQTTAYLNPPASWLDATDSPVVLNGQFTVTNSLSGAKFYRLRY